MNVGIQCCKRNDIQRAVHSREGIRVDPFGSKIFLCSLVHVYQDNDDDDDDNDDNGKSLRSKMQEKGSVLPRPPAGVYMAVLISVHRSFSGESKVTLWKVHVDQTFLTICC